MLKPSTIKWLCWQPRRRVADGVPQGGGKSMIMLWFRYGDAVGNIIEGSTKCLILSSLS
jgi:hypothetical protein